MSNSLGMHHGHGIDDWPSMALGRIVITNTRRYNGTIQASSVSIV